ncbi:MAG TPA: AAA family ATPase [Chitinophagaceae bacterium]|nr:AAA family ATPase [Chitinophagaceae bacterium]
MNEPAKIKPSKIIHHISKEESLLKINGVHHTTAFDKFKKSILDQKKDYPLPVPVVGLFQNGEIIPVLTLKSFSLWQGKQKSKKTTVLALLIAAFIKQEAISDTIDFVGMLPGSILFFDNEQGESYAARTMKMILKLVGVEYSDKLIYCDLRDHSPKERLEIIHSGIQNTPNVKLVIIDGLVDLMTDFMDASEGHLTATDMIRLCSQYDIHIAGVLHQNKNDKNARAHIGSISSQKCEIEISTEVDPEDRSRSIITCLNSRGLPFEPFAIRWDKGSLPTICHDWTMTGETDKKINKNYHTSKEISDAVFKPLVALTYVESIASIMSTKKMSESTAKRKLNEFLAWGIVAKGDDKRYRMNEPLKMEGSEGS